MENPLPNRLMVDRETNKLLGWTVAYRNDIPAERGCDSAATALAPQQF